MAGRLQRKLALVTAAGQGIGRAIAEAFAIEGATVIATDVEEHKLTGMKSAKHLNVRSTEAVEKMAKDVASEFGALDVLVNCAGFVHHGSVLECSEQDWDFTFDLNVKSMQRQGLSSTSRPRSHRSGAFPTATSTAPARPRSLD